MILHDVHANKDGVFNTGSGKLINLNRPTVDMICIGDIAASLSKICRFGGHCHTFYSVAQHSVLVTALAPEYLGREALLHDAAEAYLGDVIKPLKNLIGIAYEELEREFMQVIMQKFQLDASNLIEIKVYDKMALQMEHEKFIRGDDCEWMYNMNNINLNPSPWEPQLAQRYFIQLYKILFKG